jgi:MoaA/NifB/PqqE/SkfB family radical SAM enzyme
MSLEFYRNILEAFPRAISVGLAGLGEPTLHPSLVEMVVMAKSRRMRTSIITNGTRLHEIGAGLIEAGLDRLCISLKCLHRDDFSALTKTPAGVFDRVRENVQLIVALCGKKGSRMDIRLAWVVSRSRLKDIPAAIQMARELGVKHLDLQNLIPSPSGAFTLDEVLVKEDVEAVRQLEDFRASHGENREVEVLWPTLVSRDAAAAGRNCRWYWNTVRVDAFGRMNACGRFYPPREHFVPPLGGKVFNSPHFMEWRRYFLDSSRELPSGCRFCVENHRG